jgi:hypothetical protein
MVAKACRRFFLRKIALRRSPKVNKTLGRFTLMSKAGHTKSGRISSRAAIVPWLLFLVAGLSKGDTLSFTFTEPTVSANVLTGTLLGTLQGDNNTFVVTGFGSLALNGVLAATLPTNVVSFDTTQGDNVGTEYPTVTLDGTYMDLWANTPGNGSVLWIADGDQFASDQGGPYTAGYGEFGPLEATGCSAGNGTWCTYAASEWSANMVPEPSPFLLVSIALALVAAVKKQRWSLTNRNVS